MNKALDDFGIEKLSTLANEMCDNGKSHTVSGNQCSLRCQRSVACQLHCTIRLISDVKKLIPMGAGCCIRTEISAEYCVYVKDTGT